MPHEARIKAHRAGSRTLLLLATLAWVPACSDVRDTMAPATPIPAAPGAPIPQTLHISGGMSAEYQSIRVSQGGAPTVGASVAVNGVTMPHIAGDLYAGRLPTAVAAGGTLHLKVSFRGDTIEASGTVTAPPAIVEPLNGAAFASTAGIRLKWTSAQDPDSFEVCLNCWENSLYGEVHHASGTAREHEIAAGRLVDFGSGTNVVVTARRNDFLTFRNSPASGSQVVFLAHSSTGVFRIHD